MTVCPKCKFYNICKGRLNETVENCVRFKSVEQTNEEWMKQANTEQLADKLTDFSFWLVVTIPTEDRREKVRKRIVEWLKQPHTDKE
jgi:hypothetical protein